MKKPIAVYCADAQSTYLRTKGYQIGCCVGNAGYNVVIVGIGPVVQEITRGARENSAEVVDVLGGFVVSSGLPRVLVPWLSFQAPAEFSAAVVGIGPTDAGTLAGIFLGIHNKKSVLIVDSTLSLRNLAGETLVKAAPIVFGETEADFENFLASLALPRAANDPRR